MDVRTEDWETGAGPLADWVQTNTGGIPVLPDLAIRVIALAADPDASVAHLSRVVSKDQVLATRLLGLANSAYSAASAEVTTIPEAVVRVGANGVRNLAVTVCFASRMHDRNVYGPKGQTLVDHGVGTAYLARLIADEVDEDAEEAFLCGLLHDIGKLVMLKSYNDHIRRTRTPLDDDQVEALVARWHATVAGIAFRRWNLPAELDEPVTCHHDYSQAVERRRLSAVVYLANRLSHKYGFGCDPEDFNPLEDPASAELGLDAAWFDGLDSRAPGLYAVAKQVLA